jgi:phosphoribosyl 1,2-cyclic phosphate phosphodiesterase
MILLGTGTSTGVPSLGCDCDVCVSDNPKNKRLRTSALLGLPEGNLLLDTSPDLRTQLLREDIGVIHAALFTHEHADHIFGLDDLRLSQFYLDGPVPLYCEPSVEARIRKSFDYAFLNRSPTHVGAAPSLTFVPIDESPFCALGASVTPIPLVHGPRFRVLGFRFGNVAYCTDTNEIPAASMAKLQGLDVLILDALRQKRHPTHLSLDEAVAIAKTLKPKQTYFIHMSHHLEHEATNRSLPKQIQLAHDGLRINLT